ncbi:ABC transporter permease [Bordetella petrii]|uniref:ABC transporter permease n=1 Tax=Bordetella petrii TaxID=94624 RepID=A0ABT7W385_9BORD|nr:ABC transporter permease [Bordetella petrii]MDM9559639.1 ABC transporter permease [Bordetella petrii]
MKALTWVNSFTALLCVVLISPIFIVMVLSFSGDALLQFPPRSFSLRWYENFFGDSRWRDALYNSLVIGLGACLIATSVGFLAAYALVRGKFKAKKLALSFILLPLIIPHVISAIALYFLSSKLGLIGVRPWISVAHAVIGLPIVVLILVSALQSVDENVERAAYSMGASRWTTFRRVVIPLALPGVVSAVLFSFLTSFDELIIAMFLAGLSAETLQVRIWNSLLMDAEPIIAAVSALLIMATVLFLALDASLRRMRARRL